MRIGRVVVPEDDFSRQPMVVAIEVLFDKSSFAFDELLKVKGGSVPELDHAGEIRDVAGFSIDGEGIR